MSQIEIATGLLILGGLAAMRLGVFAVLVVSIAIIVGLVGRGIAADEAGLAIVVQTIIGVVLFQGAYLLAGMLLTLTRQLVGRPRPDAQMPHKKDR